MTNLPKHHAYTQFLKEQETQSSKKAGAFNNLFTGMSAPSAQAVPRLHTRRSHRVLWNPLHSQTKTKQILGYGIIALVGMFLAFQVYNAIYDQQIFAALGERKTVDPSLVTQNKTLAAVNQQFELPSQTGQVGVITDVQRLATKKSYFAKARNGDVLLIYPTMTIVYDPVNKYIVDIHLVHLLK